MTTNSLNVYVFNIGAGDHVLLEFPDGCIGIIDSFFQASHLDLQEVPALTYLKAVNSRKKREEDNAPIIISFLCISHADLDHLTGLDMLLDYIELEENNIVVDNLWLFGGKDMDEYLEQVSLFLDEYYKHSNQDVKNELKPRIKSYRRRLERLKRFRNNWRKNNKHGAYERYFDDIKELAKYGSAGNYEAFSFGPVSSVVVANDDNNLRAMMRVLLERVQNFQNSLPEHDQIASQFKVNRNDLSAILAVKFGNYNLLFGGDATLGIWAATLRDLQTRKKDFWHPDFIKASHHGSEHSSSEALWEYVIDSSKENIFIGISAGKRYSHPHDKFYEDVVKVCQKAHVKAHFLRTNECFKCQRIHHDGQPVAWFDDWENTFDYEYLRQVNEALDNEIQQEGAKQKGPQTNLLAHIFVFPLGGTNKTIRTVRGTSKKIGVFDGCVFDHKSYCFCNAED